MYIICVYIHIYITFMSPERCQADVTHGVDRYIANTPRCPAHCIHGFLSPERCQPDVTYCIHACQHTQRVCASSRGRQSGASQMSHMSFTHL